MRHAVCGGFRRRSSPRSPLLGRRGVASPEIAMEQIKPLSPYPIITACRATAPHPTALARLTLFPLEVQYRGGPITCPSLALICLTSSPARRERSESVRGGARAVISVCWTKYFEIPHGTVLLSPINRCLGENSRVACPRHVVLHRLNEEMNVNRRAMNRAIAAENFLGHRPKIARMMGSPFAGAKAEPAR